MKFSVKKSLLEQALLPVCKIVSTKTTLPLIENVLLEAKEQQLKIVATDLEIGMEMCIDVDVLEEGSTTVPAKVFADVISNLKNVNIEIIQDEKTKLLEIKGEGFNYKFNTCPSDEFPLLPEVIPMQSFCINSTVLKEAIKDTVFAASPPGDVNTVLCGVFFQVNEGKLIMVATDGRRLARKTIILDEKNNIATSFIVPVKALNELVRILSDSEEKLQVTIGGGQVLFKSKVFSFFSRLIEGQFPPYENIIPEESNNKLNIEREKLLLSLKRAVILAQERETPKLVKIRASDGKMIITANTQDLGQAYEEVEYKGEAVKELAIAFNARFLIDVLGTIPNTNISFEISDPVKPAVVRPSEQNGYLYVVMPIKTA